MANQFELFNKGDKPKKKPKKLRWDKQETLWITSVRATEKEYICPRCEAVIPVGSQAIITVNFDGKKPGPGDFKNAKHWHPGGKCPKSTEQKVE